MRLGALTLVLLGLSMMATVVLFVISLSTGDRALGLFGLGGLALTFVLFVTYRIFAASAHCPLCRGPVLKESGAQRNRRARTLLRSHRLRVATSIIFTNTFVCPYCHEPTRCVVKERPKGGQVAKRRSAYHK